MRERVRVTETVTSAHYLHYCAVCGAFFYGSRHAMLCRKHVRTPARGRCLSCGEPVPPKHRLCFECQASRRRFSKARLERFVRRSAEPPRPADGLLTETPL